MTARTTSSKKAADKRFLYYPMDALEWRTLEQAKRDLLEDAYAWGDDQQLVIFEAKFIGKNTKMEIVPFE